MVDCCGLVLCGLVAVKMWVSGGFLGRRWICIASWGVISGACVFRWVFYDLGLMWGFLWLAL